MRLFESKTRIDGLDVFRSSSFIKILIIIHVFYMCLFEWPNFPKSGIWSIDFWVDM